MDLELRHLYQFLLGPETVGADKLSGIPQIQRGGMKKARRNEVEIKREVDHWSLKTTEMARITPTPEPLVPLMGISQETRLQWMLSILWVSPVFLAKEISSFGSNDLFIIIISD